MWHFNREEQIVSLSSNIIHRVIVPFCMNDGWGGGGGGGTRGIIRNQY